MFGDKHKFFKIIKKNLNYTNSDVILVFYPLLSSANQDHSAYLTSSVKPVPEVSLQMARPYPKKHFWHRTQSQNRIQSNRKQYFMLDLCMANNV